MSDTKIILPEKKNVDINKVLDDEINSKAFARMCQLFSNRKTQEIRIPFNVYDSIENKFNRLKETNEQAKFLSMETINVINLVRIIEFFLKEDITSLQEIAGAQINPSLCKGKSFVSYEDHASLELVIKLISE